MVLITGGIGIYRPSYGRKISGGRGEGRHHTIPNGERAKLPEGLYHSVFNMPSRMVHGAPPMTAQASHCTTIAPAK